MKQITELPKGLLDAVALTPFLPAMNILQKTPTGKYADFGAMIAELIDSAAPTSSNRILARAGLSAGTIARWKKGKNLKTIELVRKLADVCEEIRKESECQAAQAFEGVATPETEIAEPATAETDDDEWLS